MKFDFVDIGTSDFETSVREALNQDVKVLLVEPIKYYLDKLPNYDNVLKANFAISNRRGKESIFYLEEKTILEHNLPVWLKGCNTLGKYHPLILENLQRRKLSLDLVKQNFIDLITFSDLCVLYDIREIGILKIDTEGHDHIILDGVLKKVKEQLKIKTIIFEYIPDMNNTEELDKLSQEFEALGYSKTWETTSDIRLEKNVL